ncbi:hypothetical protein Bbelb_132010 [Branchiostoma belcheri]|nr:hypothetical protein Bbelb_132010 [Branchiostoma belcheri]
MAADVILQYATGNAQYFGQQDAGSKANDIGSPRDDLVSRRQLSSANLAIKRVGGKIRVNVLRACSGVSHVKTHGAILTRQESVRWSGGVGQWVPPRYFIFRGGDE